MNKGPVDSGGVGAIVGRRGCVLLHAALIARKPRRVAIRNSLIAPYSRSLLCDGSRILAPESVGEFKENSNKEVRYNRIDCQNVARTVTVAR